MSATRLIEAGPSQEVKGQRHGESALRALGAANRVLLRAEDESRLLRDICLVLVEEGGYPMAWIGRGEGEPEENPQPLACAGLNVDLETLRSWVESQELGGASAAALHSGKPCVECLSANDEALLLPEPLPGSGHDAPSSGYRAVAAFPWTVESQDRRLVGTLTLYAEDGNAFGALDVGVLAQLAEDLAFGICTLREQSSKERAEARLARKERALRTLSAGNRSLLRSAECQGEEQLLEDMCRCAVEAGGYTYAWVGYADHGAEKRIVPKAAVGVGLDHFASLGLAWGDGGRESPSEVAIRSGKPSARRDFRNDPGLSQWADDSRRLGFAAASAYPLWVNGEVIGAFGVGAAEMDAFDDDELAILAEMADDLAFGIATVRLHAKQAEAERTIRRLAYEDSLTGLPNRARMREALEETIVAARQHHRSFALLMANVDRFRDINEVIGYRQGDRLLQQLARRLQTLFGEAGLVARVAGDEFALVMPQADIAQSTAMARRILHGFDAPFEFDGIPIDVRLSIGIALFPGHGSEPDQLTLRADAAMAQAKRNHTGVALARASGDKEALQRLTMIGELRRGIESDHLRLYCQPKADIRSGKICGAEALVRWQHPERGLILPDMFIPLAERTGLITSLTYWVLNAALGQSYAWHEAGLDVPLAVNLSTHDLQAPDFLEQVDGLVATWGADPSWIQFELTESALMDDPVRALEVLKRLEKMGFRLFVDDFGAGYSSLGYLQKLPLHAMKIDKSFVLNMERDPDSQIIVHSTIDLGHNIGLEVVAEGTENSGLWQQLEALGSDVAQGNYISEPIPADQFQAWHGASPWSPSGLNGSQDASRP